jgi:hypothetical protein
MEQRITGNNSRNNIAQVPISPTFFEQLFHTKVRRAAFPVLKLRHNFLGGKEISAKTAHKMLVKLTIDRL